MAHRGVWITGGWKCETAVKKGQCVEQSTGATKANQVKLVAPAAAAATYGTILPLAVAVRDLKIGELFDGHLAGPPSEIIELKANSAFVAGDEVIIDSAGEAIKYIAATHVGAVYIVGIAAHAVADGDIFECTVRPRYEVAG